MSEKSEPLPSATPGVILALNAGSSSLKFAAYSDEDPPRLTLKLRGGIDGIGSDHARFTQSVPAAKAGHRELGPTTAEAIAAALEGPAVLGPVKRVGHRIVHPGLQIRDHQVITPGLIGQLRAAVPIDPTHLPLALEVIAASQRLFPDALQIACLDTVFHREMPRGAQLLPLPRTLLDRGIRRLGFHGLSYGYLMEALEAGAGRAVAQGRVVLAHLGAGASMAAVRDGRCIDTTMGFTANAGLMMATRCGDLDPGLIPYLMGDQHLDAASLDEFLSLRCGLRGVSGTSGDIRALLARAAGDPAARDALTLFVVQARRWLGALIMALGGLDTVVFSGGIGEHAAVIRADILAGCGFLGLELDERANTVHAQTISTPASRVRVLVLATDEEGAIARLIQRFSLIPSP